jgi:transposase
MSLHPSLAGSVPEQTAKIAHAAFPKGTPCLTLRDGLGTLCRDEDFSALFPPCGQPALSPWLLALVTILQFRENLSDRQAAEAVRARIDWKYLLGLELDDPGFDFSVLCEFRGRLIAGGAEMQLLEGLLDQCRQLGLVKAKGRQRTDSTHVLASVRTLGRLELVGETRGPPSTRSPASSRTGCAVWRRKIGMNGMADVSKTAACPRRPRNGRPTP